MPNVTFQLKSGANTFDFDIAGGAASGGAPAGKWTTGKTNQIVLTKPDTTTVEFAVDWQFNGQNQLRILSGGTEVVNFHAGDALPLYSNRKDVLLVKPDDQNAFQFELRGTWQFDAQHNLTFTAGGQDSTLDGFLQDPEGQFSYHFFDQANIAGGNESVLTFPGVWRHAVEDGKPMLDFDYEKDDGSAAGTFHLPDNINIDPSINEFVYDYDKNNQSFRLQFVGTLHISSDFTITYSLDRQTSSTGAVTTFKFGATFHNKNFDGNLNLNLKNDGTGTSLAIGGKFTAMLGTTKLAVGFQYTQPINGNTQSFGFNGSLVSQTGNDLSWNFTGNSTQMKIDVTAHAVLGKVTATTKVSITAANGQVVGVHALLGIQF